MLWPAVNRVAPKLTCGREIIRWNTGYHSRISFIIQVEELRMGPYVRAVHRNKNRNITDDLNALFMRIIHQVIPLLEKAELHEFIEVDFTGIFFCKSAKAF